MDYQLLGKKALQLCDRCLALDSDDPGLTQKLKNLGFETEILRKAVEHDYSEIIHRLNTILKASVEPKT